MVKLEFLSLKNATSLSCAKGVKIKSVLFNGREATQKKKNTTVILLNLTTLKSSGLLLLDSKDFWSILPSSHSSLE